MSVRPGKEIVCDDVNYSTLAVSTKGYVIYAFPIKYELPKMCLSKGQAVIDTYPCYYIKLEEDYFPTIILVIRFICGREVVVLMKDRDIDYSKSRLLYAFNLDSFKPKFAEIKVVSKLTESSEFIYPFKLDPDCDDEIKEKYVSQLSQKVDQIHPEILPKNYSQKHWYNFCCYQDNRARTQEPPTFPCLSPQERAELKEKRRLEKEEQEKQMKKAEQKKKKKEAEYHKKRQEEIRKINEAPKLDIQTGKIIYNKPYDLVGEGRYKAIIYKRQNANVNTNLHDFPTEKTELDIDPNESLIFDNHPYQQRLALPLYHARSTQVPKPPKPPVPKKTVVGGKKKEIIPKSTKLVRDRIRRAHNEEKKVYPSDSDSDSEPVEIQYGYLVMDDDKPAPAPKPQQQPKQQQQQPSSGRALASPPQSSSSKQIFPPRPPQPNLNKTYTASMRIVKDENLRGTEDRAEPKRRQTKNKKVLSPSEIDDSILNI